MGRSTSKLEASRKQVDRIDRHILLLLANRMKTVEKIARIKRASGLSVYAPDREESLLREIVAANHGRFPQEALRVIYREIMSAGRSVAQPLRIAFLGPAGTFTEQAARKKFGTLTTYTSAASISDVFYDVDRRKADYGVVPVENSSEGAVSYTLDMFMDSEVKICGEEMLPVSHVLMTHAKRKEDIRHIYSHPQVFGQCRRWIEINLPRAVQFTHRSTAEAAQAVGNHKHKAAIGPAIAASTYGLPIISRGLEDVVGNTTRFLVLAKSWSRRTEKDKTSLMIALKDRVGALYGMLKPFRQNHLNLTSIESRPSRKRPWEYYFFVDCGGHIDEPRVARAVRQLEPLAATVKILGSYPAAASAAR